jgi:hypothetical protein
MNSSVFRAESIPQVLPSWVVLIKEQNGLFDVCYDPYAEGFPKLAAQEGRYIQILQEMGFKNPEFNFNQAKVSA